MKSFASEITADTVHLEARKVWVCLGLGEQDVGLSRQARL